jgi:hypothetical protein
MDGLRRVPALKTLLNVYDRSGGDPVTPATSAPELAPPVDPSRSTESLPEPPGPAPAPSPAPVVPKPVPYGLPHLADPLFVREQVVEVTLRAQVPAELTVRLLGLGFSVAKTGLDVDFVGIAAREYRAVRSGERYPCFSPEDAPVVRIAGIEADGAGDVVLFLAGPHGQEQVALPPGKEHLVALGPLAVGRYALDVLTIDPSHTPERLLFEVDAQAGRAPVVFDEEVASIYGPFAERERLRILGAVPESGLAAFRLTRAAEVFHVG